jgi:hypothetical protein
MHAILLLILLATTDTPTTAQGWFQLATTRHKAGDHRGALTAFAKAKELGFGNPVQLALGEARTQTALGDRDAAFAALQRAVDAGFGRSIVLFSDDELVPLRQDARFKDIAAAVSKNQHACTSPEYRQFDYWLGEWDVEVQGRKTARSSIQIILDDCVVYENYATLDGAYQGKSFSLYDANTKKWEQRYVDTTGRLSAWTGGLDGDVVRFFNESVTNGVKTLQRMSYIKEGPDSVRQVIEGSSDGGKTWSSPSFSGLYVRRK